MSYGTYMWCFVPRCTNTSVSTPNKIFVRVPRDYQRKKRWFTAVRRDMPKSKSEFFCCEEHFNLEEDMENYVRFKLMGGKKYMKLDVVPHIFDCQADRKRTASHAPARSLPMKRGRKRLVLEAQAANKQSSLETPLTNTCQMEEEVELVHQESEDKEKSIGIQVRPSFRRCDQCDKAFKTKGDLVRHKITVHVAERNYNCDQCDKTFKTKSNLRLHKTGVHVTDNIYKCEQCDRPFKAKLYLAKHKFRVHDTEKNYKCNQCNKAYKDKRYFVKHKLRMHGTEGAFQCEECSKRFTSSNYLRKHFKSHHEINCDLYDHKCKHKNDLVHHKRNVHLIVEMIENVKEIDEVKVEPTVIYDMESTREVIKEEPEELVQSVTDMEVKNEPVDIEESFV